MNQQVSYKKLGHAMADQIPNHISWKIVSGIDEISTK